MTISYSIQEKNAARLIMNGTSMSALAIHLTLDLRCGGWTGLLKLASKIKIVMESLVMGKEQSFGTSSTAARKNAAIRGCSGRRSA